jgi:TPR repeat protein
MKSYLSLLTLISVMIFLTKPAWPMNEEPPRPGKRKPDTSRKVKARSKKTAKPIPDDEGINLLLGLNSSFIPSDEKENFPPETVQRPISYIDQLQDEALFSRGIDFLQGVKVAQNLYNALRFFLKAAEKGQNEAIIIIGKLNHPIPTDDEIIRQSLGEGFFRLAYNYQTGTYDNFPQDINMALFYYRIASQLNNAPAQLNLAYLLKCTSNDQNLEEPFYWCSKAADQGFAPAQYTLGICYTEGIGVSKDPVTALEWFYRAAQNGHPEARGIRGDNVFVFQDSNIAKAQLTKGFYRVGGYYETGGHPDFPQNLEKARDFFKNAAQLGCASAQIKIKLIKEVYLPSIQELDLSLQTGILESAPTRKKEELAQELFNLGSDTKNPEEAIKYFLKAYKKGHPMAKVIVTAASQKHLSLYKECLAEGYLALGEELETGTNLDQNFVKALSFYDRAHELGLAQAKISYDKLYSFFLHKDWFSEYHTPQFFPKQLKAQNKRAFKRNQPLPQSSQNTYIQSVPPEAATLAQPPQSPDFSLLDHLLLPPQALQESSSSSILQQPRGQRGGTLARTQDSIKPIIRPIIARPTVPPPPPTRHQTFILPESPMGGLVRVIMLNPGPPLKPVQGPSTFGN